MMSLVSEILGMLKALFDSSGNVSDERDVLLKMQRLISDELAKRELSMGP